jgi:hypothetical protein
MFSSSSIFLLFLPIFGVFWSSYNNCPICNVSDFQILFFFRIMLQYLTHDKLHILQNVINSFRVDSSGSGTDVVLEN